MKKSKLLSLLLLPSLVAGAFSLTGCTKDDLNKINSRISNIENDITSLKAEVEAIKKQISELQTKLTTSIQSVKDEYTKMIGDLEAEIVTLNNELVLLKTQFKEDIDTVKKDYDDKIYKLSLNLDTEVTALEAKITSAESKIKDLGTKHDADIKAAKEDYDAKIATLNQSFTDSLAKVDTSIANLNKQISDLDAKLAKDKTELKADYEAKIAALEKTHKEDVGALNALVEENAKAIKDLETKHDADKKSLKEDYDAQIKALGDTHEADKKALEDDYNKKLAELEAKFDAEVETLQKDVDANTQSIKDLESKHDTDIKNVTDGYNKAVADLEAKHDYDVSVLEGLIEENSTLIANNTKAIKELKATHEADLKAAKEDYDAQIKALGEAHDTDKKALEADYNKKISDLNETFEAKVDELNKAISSNTALIKQLETKHDEDIAKAKADYDKQITDLDAKLESEVAKLEKSIEDNVKEIKEFKATYEEEKKAIVADYEAKIKAVTDDYTKKIEDTNAEITKLTGQVSDLKTELEGKIQALKDDYDVQIASLTSRVSELEKVTYHTVTFDTDGGTLIDPQVLEHGSHINKPQDPVKEGYDFEGWVFENKLVDDDFFLYYILNSNITLTAKFTLHVYSFQVKVQDELAGYFKVNSDQTEYTKYEADIEYGTNITLTAYEINNSTFTAWKCNDVVISNEKTFSFKLSESNCDIVAEYNLPPVKCTFQNYDGTNLGYAYANVGGSVVYSGNTPTKTAETGYYSWIGWDKPLNNIIQETTFTAQFEDTGDVLYHYCVFINYDGEQLGSASTFSGGSVTYNGVTPTKPQFVEDLNVTNYTFDGWDKSLTNISGATTFIAKYKETKFIGYKVNFLDYDKTPLYSYYCKSGTAAIYPYELPFSYDATHVRMFAGWGSSLLNITEPKTFVAEYKSVSRNANGEYPTTLVKDNDLISALDEISSVDEKGYKSYQGKKYLKQAGVAYVDKDGENVTAGEHYYLVEPIQWKYLANRKSNIFVTSSYLLDTHRYNESYTGTKEKTDYKGNVSDAVYANNYKFSEMRTWFNTDFLNQAFNDVSKIVTTTVINSVASTESSTNPYVCPPTEDKIFTLSANELSTVDYGFNGNSDRQVKTTEFARARGATVVATDVANFFGNYWTRSPNNTNAANARYIDADGKLQSGRSVSNTGTCIRPSLCFYLG